MITTRTSILLVLSVGAALGCGGHSATASSTASSAGSSASDSAKVASNAATPVTMGQVERRTLDVTVMAPGVLDVGEDVRVRAPFNGVVSGITVNVGDVVGAGQSIGSIIAENSDAALRGARAMVAGAATPEQKSAADRALQVAQENLVTSPLRVQKAGIVIARPASSGERVLQGDSVVSIAATGRMIFLADVAQSDLMRVHAGQHARVTLAARTGSVAATVHGVMPSDTGSLAALRVRLDIVPGSAPPTVGMSGSATIVVSQRVDVPVVPKAALVRDDITGITKIAVVDSQDMAHWIDVTPGVVDSAWAEITQPQLTVGQRVITTGMIGLPDSTRVVQARDSTSRDSTSRDSTSRDTLPPVASPSIRPAGTSSPAAARPVRPTTVRPI